MMCAARAAGKPTGFLPIRSSEALRAGQENEKSSLQKRPKRLAGNFATTSNAFALQDALLIVFAKIFYGISTMKNILGNINQFTGGSIDIIKRTSQRISEERAAEAAASMAYYGFFSLFPLLLVAVVIVSTVLENMLSQEQVLEMLMKAIPFSSELIAENLGQVLNARGSVGVIGLVGLAWSAMGVFTVLMRNINRAWPNAKDHNFFKMRLMAFVMLVVLMVGLISLFVFNMVRSLLPPDLNDMAEKASSTRSFPYLLIGVLLFAALMVLYWWLPTIRVRWTEAAWGSLVGAMGISVVTAGFTWYLQSGLSNYNLVYGSLGAIVALLFWIYLLSLIIFAGAHLSAAIAYYQRNQPDEPED
ncbi:MAG TPA: hypothetical protein DEH22_16265 [Chloroflexi bacterium]|nr:hypothetical protein [Chloroflexota bacterium]